MQYEDPLGAVLLIAPAPDLPMKLGPAPGEEILPNGERIVTVGKNTYHELKVVATEDETHVARFRFHTIQPGGSYVLMFECEARTRTRTRTCSSGSWRASKSTRARRRRGRPPKAVQAAWACGVAPGQIGRSGD